MNMQSAFNMEKEGETRLGLTGQVHLLVGAKFATVIEGSIAS